MRKIIYLALILLVAAGTVFKAQEIEKQDKTEIVSINEEWNKNGKPADLQTACEKEFYEISKVSGHIKNDMYIYTEIPRETARTLRTGQRFVLMNKGYDEVSGKVVELSKYPNRLTGFYYVTLKLDKKLPDFSEIAVAAVKTAAMTGIAVKRQALVLDDDGTYCWVADKDNIVSLVKVEKGLEYNNYVQIKSGLEKGSRVVTGGKEVLKEGDLIRPRREEGIS